MAEPRDHGGHDPAAGVDEAAAYAELKRELATQHDADREAYTAAKSDFVRMVLDRPR